MKRAAFILGFASTLNTASAAEAEQLKDSPRIFASISTECQLLPSHGCKGKEILVGVTTSSAYKFTLEKFSDTSFVRPYSYSYDSKPIFVGQTDIVSIQGLSGNILRIEKAFRPLDQLKIDTSLYIGKVQGSIQADIGVSLNIATPAITIPTPSGRLLTIPASDSSMSKQTGYRQDGNSYFGGVKFGWAYQPLNTGRNHIVVNQFLSAGVEKTKHGAGLSLAYSSDADHDLGLRSSSICQDGGFYSKARYAFIVSACADRVTKDVLYDKALIKSEKLSGDVNSFIGQKQSILDKLNAVTGKNYSIPGATPDMIMDALNFRNPYKSLHSSFVVAASVRWENTHLTISRKQPLGSANSQLAVTSFAVAHDF